MKQRTIFLLGLMVTLAGPVAGGESPAVVSADSLRGKVMCGYQGWFRCPGDRAGQGWIHWSRDSQKITPDTLTFELWPDTTDFPTSERFAAPGFTNQDGSPAWLYSVDQPNTVLRHFEWMRTYGLDGVWLQHFLVDLPGGPVQDRYESRLRVLRDVRDAAKQTGRVWALAFDIAGMPTSGICESLTNAWIKLVNEGMTADNRYVHENGKPVVLVWGFYYHDPHNAMTAAVANELIDEVDEGTAIYKISNTPPKQGHFVTYDGLPSDWYLRLVGEGTRLLHLKQPIPTKIPINP